MLSLAMTVPPTGREQPASLEAGLVLRATGGDRDALSALLTRHARSVGELCHHVAGASDGRDAAQEALERIVRQLARFDPERGTFRNFALTVARNVCRDRLRRRGLERSAFIDDGAPAVDVTRAPLPDAERVAIARQLGGKLAQALTTLPEPMRSAIVLFHVHEASYEEIAKTLDVPVGTVMTWLHRGRQRLRAALGESV